LKSWPHSWYFPSPPPHILKEKMIKLLNNKIK
jgi:hypothetical protein